MKEPFNLEQFKQGRKAYTKSGHIVEFVYHRPDFMPSCRLGVKVGDMKEVVCIGEDGKSRYPCDSLTTMASAEVKLEMKDIPSPCWVRTNKSQTDNRAHHLVVMVNVSDVVICHGVPVMMRLQYQALKDDWEHSSDRINWYPCEKLEKWIDERVAGGMSIPAEAATYQYTLKSK